MPRYASIGLITLFYPVLLTRLRAAQKPLRIPKVFRKAVLYTLKATLKTCFIYYFIDVLAAYPGWLP